MTGLQAARRVIVPRLPSGPNVVNYACYATRTEIMSIFSAGKKLTMNRVLRTQRTRLSSTQRECLDSLSAPRVTECGSEKLPDIRLLQKPLSKNLQAG